MTTCPTKSTMDQSLKTVVVEGIGKQYPVIGRSRISADCLKDFWAVHNVHMDVFPGEMVGVIGRNGAGKTTLLNMIAGVLSPTEGRVTAKGRVLGLFNLGVGFEDELTGRDNIFLNGSILGASKKEIKDNLEAIIEFSELGPFIDMPLGTYSQGMRLRLGFSIVVNLNFDILAIDEVLAVGDTLFQNKCFERLMDFKRAGKTMIIISQNMEMVERLCDRVALLDHGKLLFLGNTPEGINKYRALLNKERFSVGPDLQKEHSVKDTKKWANDISEWGRELGTKEVVIERVEFLNAFGFKISSAKSGQRFKVKVNFSVKNVIKDPHFGIAFFRQDGVYCYGPNSAFDGCHIAELKPGKGSFTLDIQKLFLAPGEYRMSIAVWDKNETLAYHYQEGYYRLDITGQDNPHQELISMPFASSLANGKARDKAKIPGELLTDRGDEKTEEPSFPGEVTLLNRFAQRKDAFITNEPAKMVVRLQDSPSLGKNALLWAGIYRKDGVYCQGVVGKWRKGDTATITFPHMSLLPGGYKISIGVWDVGRQRLAAFTKDICLFRMVFDKPDHGTIYLEHVWTYKSA